MRQRYFKNFKNNLISHDCYKGIRNFVTTKLRESKKSYFQNLFMQSKNNIRKQWEVLNGLIKPNENSNDRNIKSLLVDDELVEDKTLICEKLNQHFSTVGSRISNEFNNATHEITSHNRIQNSLFFRNVLPNDIIAIIDNMKNKSAPINTYSVRIIKAIKHIISSVISNIINKSLQQGYFPSSLKLARVIPLHKGGRKDDINNYRPISILPIFSKNFERVVYNQLYGFLEKYNILSTDQFGFRKNKSTIQAVLNQLEFIYSNLDQNKTVVSIFMDFIKNLIVLTMTFY